MNPTQNRFEHLATQMKWRLQEGRGEAVYQIGVEDNGMLVGLSEEDMRASLKTLHRLAEKWVLDASFILCFYCACITRQAIICCCATFGPKLVYWGIVWMLNIECQSIKHSFSARSCIYGWKWTRCKKDLSILSYSLFHSLMFPCIYTLKYCMSM